MRSAVAASMRRPVNASSRVQPAPSSVTSRRSPPASIETPTLRLGQRELRVVGGDADVAHHRDLEARAEAVAVDRHQHRLRQVREHVEALVHPAEALVVVARLLGRRAAGDAVLGHAEVHARAEGAPLGAHDHHAHVVAEAQRVGVRRDLPRGLPAPGVELLGPVQHERGDRAVHGEIDVRGRIRHSSANGPLPSCSRIGTKSGWRIARRCQLAPSTTRVWPVT